MQISNIVFLTVNCYFSRRAGDLVPPWVSNPVQQAASTWQEQTLGVLA